VSEVAVNRPNMTGWVGAGTAVKVADREGIRTELEAMGIVVGTWDEASEGFEDCTVSPEALDKLDERWGEFFWSLRSVEIAEAA
jgi:hypothetical protein